MTIEQIAERSRNLIKEVERLQTQVDSLQQKVHLCAGYDALTERNKKLEDALRHISANRDMTLLGCSPDNEYPDCPAGEESAHQYGAVKAFNQCADIADKAIAELEDAN